MNPREYADWVKRFDNHSNGNTLLFSLACGLASEAGEVAGILEKFGRKGAVLIDEDHLAEELGDVLWNVTRIASLFGFTLDDLMRGNVDKLIKRYTERGIKF